MYMQFVGGNRTPVSGFAQLHSHDPHCANVGHPQYAEYIDSRRHSRRDKRRARLATRYPFLVSTRPSPRVPIGELSPQAIAEGQESVDLFTFSQLMAQRQRSQQAYLEFLRVPALSAGLYFLPAGARDRSVRTAKMRFTI